MSPNHIKQYNKAPFSVRIVKFGCEMCGRRWQSANGSLIDYQKCKKCYTECYPASYKWQAPNKEGNENRQTFQPHNTKLCGKCERLGHSCMELGITDDHGDVIVSNANEEEIRLTTSNDLWNYVKEPVENPAHQRTISTVANPMSIRTIGNRTFDRTVLFPRKKLEKPRNQNQFEAISIKRSDREDEDWRAFLEEGRLSKKEAFTDDAPNTVDDEISLLLMMACSLLEEESSSITDIDEYKYEEIKENDDKYIAPGEPIYFTS